MAKLEFAVFALVAFGSGGDEHQFSGPAQGQVVHGELGGITEMRVPAFARADEKYVVAGVVYDVAAVTEAKRKLGVRQGWFGKDDEEIVVAAHAALAWSQALVLEEFERMAAGVGNAFDIERTGESEDEQAVGAGIGADVYGGGGVQGMVGQDGSFDGVVQRMKDGDGGALSGGL